MMAEQRDLSDEYVVSYDTKHWEFDITFKSRVADWFTSYLTPVEVMALLAFLDENRDELQQWANDYRRVHRMDVVDAE